MSYTEEQKQIRELHAAEMRRQTKAAGIQLVTEIPKSIGEVDAIAARFDKITEIINKRPPQNPNFELLERAGKSAELLRQAMIPERHAKKDEFQGEEWKERLDKLDHMLGTGFIGALIGTRGTGKTQMACELIKDNSNRLKSSRFVLAMDVFLAIRSSYRKESKTDEAEVVAEFCKPKLLVIDEIQERAESAFEDRILTHIINRRYNSEKDTLLIGNIKEAEFKAAMGASIISRLNETGGLITCEWKGYR